MGFSIITTHLVMLERAFDRSLNTQHPGGNKTGVPAAFDGRSLKRQEFQGVERTPFKQITIN